MPDGWVIVLLSVAYLGLLFVIAQIGDAYAARWRGGRVERLVYALALAIYCTSWTFYGAVGRAASNGLDFLLIYVGPILVITLGAPVFARIIGAAKRQNSTSIADFLASRYGRSRPVGAIVTVIATVGVVPYIALQLKAVSTSFTALTAEPLAAAAAEPPLFLDTAFLVAAAMAAFTILFGLRTVEAAVHHRGLMMAIAFESAVKLLALVAVGLFVTFEMAGGLESLVARLRETPEVAAQIAGPTPGLNWLAITLLAGLAFLCLPRQFHVAVVEYGSAGGQRTARWLFPLYLVAINLFVVPIAAMGLFTPAAGVNPDLYVVTLPLVAGNGGLSVFAFIGGLSAATSMVIVAGFALSVMIGNELVTPLLLRSKLALRRDIGGIVLTVRHFAVVVILLCAYVFERASAHVLPLASIGLISFCAVAQFAPALLIGLYWRGAHRHGVIAGLLGGCAIWACLLLFPLLGAPDDWLVRFGNLVREAAGAALGPLDNLSQAVFASLAVNLSLLIGVSLLARRERRDVTQAEAFVAGERRIDLIESDLPSAAELKGLVARFVGEERAAQAFTAAPGEPAEMVAFAERLLSGAIGAASAHIMVRSGHLPLNLSRREARAMLGEAAAAILQNAELLRSTLDSVSQGIAVFDERRELAVWNEPFLALSAIPRPSARAGAPIAELSALAGFDLGEDRPSRRLRLGDGRILTVNRDAMRNGGMVITLRDVTDEERAAEAIRDSERRIRIYTDNVPVLIAYIDRDERYRFTNLPYQKALNLSSADLDGRSLTEVLGAARYDELKPHIAAVLRGEPQSFEIGFPTNDQHIEIAQGNYIPHLDERGTVQGFFLLYQDITERRHAEQALRQAKGELEERVQERTAELARLVQQLSDARQQAETANQSKTRFLAAASHDLLQPLHAARLFSAALLERRPTDDIVAKVDRSLAAVEAILDALLDVAKLDAGAVKPSVGTVPLGPLLAALPDSFGALAERNNLDLRIVPTSLNVASDAQLLRRVLQNLVANAVRYAPGQGGRRAKVLVGCRRRGGQAVLQVWDNGPGIPEDKQPLVFKEFVRLPQNGLAGQERGLGLGLAIVDRIARMLNHPVTVRSEPGRGSCFGVAMPIARERAQAAAARRERPPVRPPAALTVLVVDNEAAVQDGMRTLLQGWGCRVIAAAALPEALAGLAAERLAPDVALVDLHLDNGLDGFAVIAALRAAFGADLPAALISADRSDGVRAQAREQGIAAIPKPVRIAALRALLAQCRPRTPPAAETEVSAQRA
jgi:PAS domain S-box-containing protein